MAKRRGLIPLLLLSAAVLFGACRITSSVEPGADVVVTVDGSSVLREVEPGLVFGANLGAWTLNTQLEATTYSLVEALRPSVVRFPGGNVSNNYCWVTQMVSDNDHVLWEDWSWGIDVGQYIGFLMATGCVPMFSLNPFDHTIDGEAHSAVSEAEDLAGRFVAEGYSGAFYEVGNENDGSWNPMLSIEDYTDRFILLMTAVKAVDPGAQSMGPVVSSYDMTWINGFLDRLEALGATDLLDWISYHHYGGWISNSNQDGIDVDDPQALAAEVETIRSALAARGLARIKIAVTEMNAAIWDEGCTRGQFTIAQGLWLADALGVCLSAADAANVWIHLAAGTDPHALIDDSTTPPQPTKNFWPVALAAQTLSSSDPTAPVEVLSLTYDPGPMGMTGYAVRKSDGFLGLLFVNKSDQTLEVSVDLPTAPRGVTGRRLGETEYDAVSGPSQMSVHVSTRRVAFTLPAYSMAGFEVR
jgi:hypothetical protein